MIVLERVRFAIEIDGGCILAVHDEDARSIKGSRWVTTGPSLFTQAMVRRFQSRTVRSRLTKIQSDEVIGYSLVVSIGRFEAQYDEANMTNPPAIAG